MDKESETRDEASSSSKESTFISGADMDDESLTLVEEDSSSSETVFLQEDNCKTDMDKESETRGEASSSQKEIAFIRGAGTRVSKRLPGRFSTGSNEDSSKLTLWKTIGPKETFFRPYLIAATPSNGIAVADQKHGVKIYDFKDWSKGKMTIKEDADGISATHDRLVVIEKDSKYVKMYKMDGQLDFQFSTEQPDEGEEAVKPVSDCPHSVVVKKDGAIVVGDVKRMVLTVHRPKDGEIQHTIPVPIEPRFLAVDNDDRILICNKHTILVVNGSSVESFITPTVDGQPAHTMGLCCTNSAVYVVVSDVENAGHLHQYDNQGKFVECVIKSLLLPNGITVTADQRYLAVIKGNTVAIYHAEKDEENNVDAPHGSIIQGIGSLIMISRTTVKTSQSTKGQMSQEPTHFQQVLDEVNKLTENLSAIERLDRRIQLPYITLGYFNEEGGSLSLDEYNVHLTVPRGAIAPGFPQQIYIYVDPIAQPNDAADQTEVLLSPKVKCGPDGLTFNESVVLSFPHYAVLTSQGNVKPDIQVRHEDSQERQLEGAKLATVTENMVFVLLDHFCNVNVIRTATPENSKLLKIGAFGGRLDQECPQYAFRVYVVGEETFFQKVTKEEQYMKSKMLDVPRNLLFFWDSGNLAVRVSDIDSRSEWKMQGPTEETIDEEHIRNKPENSMTFNLTRPATSPDGAELYCVASTYQFSPNDDSRNQAGIRLKICPKKKKLSLLKKILGKLGRSSQQRPVSTSTEDNNRCECERTGALCGNCKERIGTGISTIVHGDVIAQEYGGLSSKAVYELCDHVDSSSNCHKLLERLTNKTGRSVEVATELAGVRTTHVLKLYFDVCRYKTNEQAIHSLVDILKELNLERAVEIIQEDLDSRDCDE